MTEAQHANFVAIVKDSLRTTTVIRVKDLPPAFVSLSFAKTQKPLTGIRAILLDIYGTLFSSAAGEIGAGADYLYGDLNRLALDYTKGMNGEELKDYFRSRVREEHLKAYPQTPYPEVRVEELWAQCKRLHEDVDPAEFALRFELAVNPAFPMPDLAPTLAALQASPLTLGIVSNAQFFTPLLFEASLGSSLDQLGFDSSLLLYSFEKREAKPSPVLFNLARATLEKRGIKSSETLYLGNDMLNDVYAAANSGFKTVLFAGDERSLRLREGHPVCGDCLPDAVIFELAELLPLLGLKGLDT